MAEFISRVVGWPIRALITVYRYTLSPMLGPRCRFEPSCSAYANEAVGRFGGFRGSWLAIKRVGKCHPWHPGGYDPVPPIRKGVDAADD